MAWIQFIFSSTADDAESLSDALMECDTNAVTFQDSADDAIFEPEVGTTPLWQTTQVIALFDANTNSDFILAQLAELD